MIALKQLFPEWTGESVQINALSLDSRNVSNGTLFLAVPGQQHDGRKFIAQALSAGAAAVAYEADWPTLPPSRVPMLPVTGLVQQLSALAGRFYGEPAQSLKLIGITGTNGKTSVSQMLAQALNLLDQPCGVIGTLGSGLLGSLEDQGMTTPDALRVQQSLAALRDQGAAWVSMEVSSHALDQGRVAALGFDLAVFTNLSRDHLDYHGDMARYGAAKARLFDLTRGSAVINLDDAFGRELAARCPVPCISFSLHDVQARLHCSDIRFDAMGIHALVHFEGQQGELHSPLLGSFNLSNLLAVLGALLALQIDLQRALQLVAGLQAPAGRMQRLGGGSQPLVVIDYAHTPDALEKALAALRAHVSGKLTCVFGCGGDRDTGKRPLMGRIAEQGADQLLVTDDNPRSEASAEIIKQILVGLDNPAQAEVVVNRAQAIARSISAAKAGDVILLAGKGHEAYQEINGVRHPFSDSEQALAALQDWEMKHA
ncbi:MAG: UDP-N-acetylmuramoyl-L-alanyl-D-glutamate--2,6-diaminopimelate ligase [Gammaproteobacteria bacterium HGW-Gammaproteobacteria-11]|nr:MAG: UDP-N-acetylmuramoyl-L-alanyl-D-glutamate--2,6-diaminopimelate ligase [Gammaproteobacteria bacterium HGW-Gammaproteobacteria-11]